MAKKKLAKKKKMKQPEAEPISNFGRFVYKPTISAILTCSCGNKYIKTRKNQSVCLQCLFHSAAMRSAVRK